jgi:opacity protein-like surface antigen
MNRVASCLLAASAMGSVASSALAQTGAAADWSGIYLGVNDGWSRQESRPRSNTLTVNQLTGVNGGSGVLSAAPTTFAGSGRNLDHDGFIGGGQLGFNAVLGGFVWGLEGDMDGVANHVRDAQLTAFPATALTSSSTVTATRDIQARWIASLRARVGAPIGRTLIYVTGGPAWVNLRERTNFSYAPSVTGSVAAANPGMAFGPYSTTYGSSDTRTGWTAGAGAEFLLNRHVTVGLEYRHTQANGFSQDLNNPGANGVFATSADRVRFRDDAVLARLNLKFSAHMF